jgi:hypothetical protein
MVSRDALTRLIPQSRGDLSAARKAVHSPQAMRIGSRKARDQTCRWAINSTASTDPSRRQNKGTIPQRR